LDVIIAWLRILNARHVLFKVIVSIIKKQPRNKLENVTFFGFLQL